MTGYESRDLILINKLNASCHAAEGRYLAAKQMLALVLIPNPETASAQCAELDLKVTTHGCPTDTPYQEVM